MQTPFQDAFGDAVLLIAVGITAMWMTAIALVGLLVAWIQRHRRKAGRLNIAVAAIAVALSIFWGGLAIVGVKTGRADVRVWSPLLVMLAATGSWLWVAIRARRFSEDSKLGTD